MTARKLRIVDLSALPSLPSIFDQAGFPLRQGIIFLHELARDISKPIARDGCEHYEYVPTQIVAEYFKHVLKVDGRRVDGIAFRSSRPGAGISYCIFTGPKGCSNNFRDKETSPLSFERQTRTMVLMDSQRRNVAQCVAQHGSTVPCASATP